MDTEETIIEKTIFLNPFILVLISVFFTYFLDYIVKIYQNNASISYLSYDQNIIINICLCYAFTLGIVALLPTIRILLAKIIKIGFKLELSIDKSMSLFIQNFLFSIFIFFIVVITQVPTFFLGNTIFTITWPYICLLILFFIKKIGYVRTLLDKLKPIMLWNEIAKLQIVTYFLCIILYYLVVTFILPTSIRWERDYYTFSNNREIFKINGIHSLKDAKLKKIDSSKEIPVRFYTARSTTYVVIDFTMDIPLEGEYLFSAIFDNKYIEHNLVYIYDGPLEYKEKSIDNLLEKIKETEGNRIDITIQQKLEELKKIYLFDSTSKVKEYGKDLEGSLLPESMKLLKETML